MLEETLEERTHKESYTSLIREVMELRRENAELFKMCNARHNLIKQIENSNKVADEIAKERLNKMIKTINENKYLKNENKYLKNQNKLLKDKIRLLEKEKI